MLLPGKIAIINGGATGMGRATAIKFAEEGCASVIADINETGACETVAEVKKRGQECIYVPCDITDLGQIKNAVDRTVEKFGTVHILVGCAGGVPRSKQSTPPAPGERPKRGIQYTDESYYDFMQDLNLKGHVFFAKEVAPYMIKQKWGRMIFISSMGVISPPGPAIEYHAAKAGILGLTYNLATELAQHNITANAILPGPVQSPFWEPVMATTPEADRAARFEQMGQSVPLGRVGQAEDIANACLFFASELSSWITGETLNVAGGKPLPVYRSPE
ncbi:MAG: SDR family oxidoreductase [Dehalococcoidales bacterium]|nr:SDR family oxidoreductase [Dehalococcoidales bacterium]